MQSLPAMQLPPKAAQSPKVALAGMVLAFGVVADAADAAERAASDGARLEPAPCMAAAFTDAKARCYDYVVRERSDVSGGLMHRLRVAVVPGKQRAEKPDPVVYFNGGPGASIASDASSLLEHVRGFGGRDAIFVEWRGYPRAEPALLCRQYKYGIHEMLAVRASIDEKIAMGRAIFEACHDEVRRAGVDPAYLTDYQYAADIDTLRALLGHEQVNVWGLSTGGGSALSYLKYYPGRVRAVMAGGVWPVGFRNGSPEEIFAGWRRQFQRLAQACLQERDCAVAYPRIAEAFDRARAALDARPFVIEREDAVKGGHRPMSLEGDDLVYLLDQMMYRTPERIPLALQKIIQGDYAGLEGDLGLPPKLQPGSPDTAEGMAWSQLCGDAGDRFADPVAQQAVWHREPGLLLFDTTQLMMCTWWKSRGAIPTQHNEPVRAAVPALLMYGEFDPCCGLEAAQYVAQGLSSAQIVKFTAVSHEIPSTACLRSITERFLDDPRRAVEAGCAGQPEAHFALPQ